MKQNSRENKAKFTGIVRKFENVCDVSEKNIRVDDRDIS